MKTLLTTLLLITILSIGCGPSVQYIGRTYSPTTNVDIFFKPSDVTKQYEVMGKIDGKAWPLTDFSKIQDKIVEEAKKRGADAIIISGMEEDVINSTKNTTTNAAGNTSGSTTSTPTGSTSDKTSWDASVTTSTTTNNQTVKVMRADFIKYK